MTNYKEVFQLAQDNGFHLTGIIYQLPEELNVLLELTLIQKWLRDEHKKFVEVVMMQPNAFAFTVYSTDEGEELAAYKLYSDIYEEALLNGINEALKLI